MIVSNGKNGMGRAGTVRAAGGAAGDRRRPGARLPLAPMDEGVTPPNVPIANVFASGSIAGRYRPLGLMRGKTRGGRRILATEPVGSYSSVTSSMRGCR